MGNRLSYRSLLPGFRFSEFLFSFLSASDVKLGPLAKQSIAWKSFLQGKLAHRIAKKAKAAANIKWQMARNGMVGIKMHAIKLAK